MKKILFNRLFLITAIFLSMASCVGEKRSSETQKQERPNIIFIMTDDHAFQAISAYGSNLIETPNIDKLAAEGMLFEKAFVTNSICSPSRAVVLTGKHSHLNGVRGNQESFDGTQVTFPKLLQKNGYQTAIVGKWHLKSEPTGYDYWKVLPGQGDYYNPEFRTQQGNVVDTGYVTNLITDFAIDWLKTAAREEKPFMLMYQHKAPHREWLAEFEQAEKFTEKEYPEPATLFDDYSGRGTAAKEAQLRIADHMSLSYDNKVRPELVEELGYEEFMGWYTKYYHNVLNRMNEEQRAAYEKIYGPINEEFREMTPEGKELTRWKYQRYMQDYLATIASVDENIGRLDRYLQENGLAENTIIIYTSDQGFYLGEHGWFDKRFMYEESFRTPLIVKWPGVTEAGSRNRHLVQNLDFAETILEMSGTAIPDEMQGLSLVPLLRGEEVPWRDALYYQFYEYPGIGNVKRHYGVRTDRYKLIHFYYDIDEWELYDLDEDPNEMNNMIDNPRYTQIKEELTEKLEELRRQYRVSEDPDLEDMQPES